MAEQVPIRVRSAAAKWRNSIRGTNDSVERTSSVAESLSNGSVDYQRNCSAELILAPNGEGCQHPSNGHRDQYHPGKSSSCEFNGKKIGKESPLIYANELRTKRAALKTIAAEGFPRGDGSSSYTTEQAWTCSHHIHKCSHFLPSPCIVAKLLPPCVHDTAHRRWWTSSAAISPPYSPG
jgi:hypothetical protein